MKISVQEGLELKRKLQSLVIKELRDSIAALQKNISELRESAESEGKSSAGDKYETGRAMIQLEIEKVAQQLQEKETGLGVISNLQLDIQEAVRRGGLVFTSEGNYFLAISAGSVSVDGQNISCISPTSPLGQLLLGKKTGDRIVIRDREFLIKNIV